MSPIKDLIGTGRTQKTMAQVDIEKATAYACADADMTGRLRSVFEEELRQEGFPDLISQVEMPLVPVLVAMQRNGISLDAGALHEMSRDLNQQLNQLEASIYNLIGHTVNINSPQQLSDLFFNELRLPKTKRTKTGYSTDANSLEGLKGHHPVIDRILEYRQVSKLKSTYVDALPQLVNPRTGRLHTSYNQTGSATGRVSSSDPNLQNIPIRTELGRKVRNAFVAKDAPDWLLLSADYSQIELRVLAHLSKDQGLVDAFLRWGRHPLCHGLDDVRCADRPGHWGHETNCQGAEFWRRLRPVRLWHLTADGVQPRRGPEVHARPTLPNTRASRSTSSQSKGRQGRPGTSLPCWAAGAICPKLTPATTTCGRRQSARQ